MGNGQVLRGACRLLREVAVQARAAELAVVLQDSARLCSGAAGRGIAVALASSRMGWRVVPTLFVRQLYWSRYEQQGAWPLLCLWLCFFGAWLTFAPGTLWPLAMVPDNAPVLLPAVLGLVRTHS